MIVAQAADKASVEAMVSDAAVILNVAGPFSEYHADNIVGACALSGTHYADLSGEYWYQRRMIDEFHEEAERSGAKIVLAAGVDSIPSDLGVQLAIEHLAAKGGRARHTKALFTSYAGSFSGGNAPVNASPKEHCTVRGIRGQLSYRPLRSGTRRQTFERR